ncbi:hypothetical protein FJ208_02425 [Candidatus Gribaldobacteria bacterium]|nr:hypothetical protein [Candidatus Gribaldobacteria bacterium]
MTKNFAYLSAVLLMVIASTGIVMAKQYQANQSTTDPIALNQSNNSLSCSCKEAGLDCNCLEKGKTCGCSQNNQTCGCSSSCHQATQ